MYRTRYEIYLDILKRAKIITGKTGIVYDCNLNFNIVKRYLEKLIEKKLIIEFKIKNRSLYQTTEKGIGYISRLEGIII